MDTWKLGLEEMFGLEDDWIGGDLGLEEMRGLEDAWAGGDDAGRDVLVRRLLGRTVHWRWTRRRSTGVDRFNNALLNPPWVG